jgi:hypothetical protein
MKPLTNADLALRLAKMGRLIAGAQSDLAEGSSHGAVIQRLPVNSHRLEAGEAAMRIGVLHVNSSSYDSTSPTMRIAKFAAEETGGVLVHDHESARLHRRAKFDVLLVKYGMLKFSQHRDEALEIYHAAKLVVNMENDYLFALDKRFRRPDLTWSTVEGRDAYVNWNILTRHPLDAWRTPRPLPRPTHHSLVYYGAARPDREASFRRYFLDAPYPVSVSTYRGQKEFKKYGPKVAVIGAFRDPDAAAAWPLTLYVEDEESHELYCSPATRFYESVMSGLAQVIDARAVGTLREAGVKMSEDFVVENKSDVAKALKRWQKIQENQRALWFRDYSIDLRKQFSEAMKTLDKH